MKQRLILLFTALILCIGAQAQTKVTIVRDKLMYDIYLDKNYAILVKIHDDNNLPDDIVIPASIYWNEKRYPVTKLEDKCFAKCHTLKSVTIPSSVTSLGKWCFDQCWSLTSVTIPSSVTSLGGSCFYFCQNLTSITIPSSVTSLGEYCFYLCIYNHRTTKTNQKYPSVNL